MAKDEEYELLPHQILADLRNEVEALKKKLTQPDTKANELILEIESMKDSIHDLNNIFQKALEQTKEEGDPGKTIAEIKEKLAEVINQNEIIAKGMIAISDKLEHFMSQQEGSGMISPSALPKPTMGVPPLAGPGRVAPFPQMEAPPFPPPEGMDNLGAPGADFPPPPPGMGAGPGKKRVGLFR